ncbi:MAG: hypothetical protein QOH93_1946 [Chloroflexia bacterium]|jgi:hypothetical protein|nr:hypothetical protein [Chloroflexia bacterium]
MSDELLKVIKFVGRTYVVLIIGALLSSILLATFFGREPSGGTSVSSPLYLSPALPIPGTPGILLVRPGEVMTAVYTVTNTTSNVSVSRRITLHGRGPRACELDWNAPPKEFGSLEYVVLRPGESMRFEGIQRFTVAGLYFVETNRQTMDGRWGAFGRRINRQYFIVGDESTIRSVDTSCVAERTIVIGIQVLLTPTP